MYDAICFVSVCKLILHKKNCVAFLELFKPFFPNYI
jgi:hypothetical protein